MKLFKVILVLVVLFASYYFYLSGGFLKVASYFDSSLNLPDLSLESLKTGVEKGKEFLPDPLVRKDKNSDGKILNSSLILEETNRHRKENGLPPFVLNSKLSLAARVKTEDMFKDQYFEHESPAGKSASDLVSEAGYGFIVVGENLAMGHFKDENDLVTAWMNSPGHRANILGAQFKEIGIYVARGEYKGDSVWMSVQEFATSESVCEKPFNSDKNKIEEDIDALETINQKLKELKQAISTANKNDPSYNKLIEDYNSLVVKYNAGTLLIKENTEKYNIDVRSYNACIAEYTSEN